MGQSQSSAKVMGPLDPGLATQTAPNGLPEYVLMECELPSNEQIDTQSNPSIALEETSVTTSKKNIDMVPGPTEIEVLHGGLMQVMQVTGQLDPKQDSSPTQPRGRLKSDPVVLLPHVGDAHAAFLSPDDPVPEVQSVVVLCFMAGCLDEPGSIVS